MLIIPAIDIYNNAVVRLSKGNFESLKSYSLSPLEQAIIYSNYGFKWVHIIDLLGSKQGKINVQNFLREVKNNLNLKIEFGGGIRNYNDAKLLSDLNVDNIIIGSLAIKNKLEFENIISDFSNKIIVAVDVLNYEIMIKGWTEKSDVHLFDHINYCLKNGIKKFLCTDIAEDGMLNGPNFTLYKRILEEFPNIELTASGGISKIEDIDNLNKINLRGVVVGKAIYENKISLVELKKYVK